VCEEVHRRDNILTVCELFGYSQVKFLLPPYLVQKAKDRSEYLLSKNVKLGLNNMTTIYHILGDGSEAVTFPSSVRRWLTRRRMLGYAIVSWARVANARSLCLNRNTRSSSGTSS
jgi:hypothetical protein